MIGRDHGFPTTRPAEPAGDGAGLVSPGRTTRRARMRHRGFDAPKAGMRLRSSNPPSIGAVLSPSGPVEGPVPVSSSSDGNRSYQQRGGNRRPAVFRVPGREAGRTGARFSAAALPDMLRQAGVEGEVLAQFVVDATGRPEPGSLKVLKSSHDMFVESVKNALPQMKFIPAELGDGRCANWFSSRSRSRSVDRR